MSVRDTINKRPALVAVAAVVAIAGGGWLTFRQVRPEVHLPDSVFYTTDDGATYYPDSIKLDPPVVKDGKEAVIARVFRINGEKKVAYMERFSPEAKRVIDQFKARQRDARNAKGPPEDLGRFIGAQQTGREYKRPGDSKWVSSRDRAAVEQIMKVVDGSGQPAAAIDP